MKNIPEYLYEDTELIYSRDKVITKEELYKENYFFCKLNKKKELLKESFQEEQRALSINLSPTKNNAIDIGARFGGWTRDLSLNFKHVYAFEPRDKWYPLIGKNVFLENVTIYPYALGSTKGYVEKMQGNSIIKYSEKSDNYLSKIYKLDDFKLKNISYIKIDVDGFELEVIKGALKTIIKNKPLIVIEQISNEKLRARNFVHNQFDASDILKELGMKLLHNIEYDYIYGW